MCHCVGASRPRGRLWMAPLWDEGRYVYAENKRTRCCDHTGDKRDVRCKCSLSHSFSLRDTLPHPCLFPPSLVTLQGPEHKGKHLNDGRAVWCVEEQASERDRERESGEKGRETKQKKSFQVLFTDRQCCGKDCGQVAFTFFEKAAYSLLVGRSLHACIFSLSRSFRQLNEHSMCRQTQKEQKGRRRIFLDHLLHAKVFSFYPWKDPMNRRTLNKRTRM